MKPIIKSTELPKEAERTTQKGVIEMKKALKLCGLTACCAVMLSSYTCADLDPSVMT